MRLGVFFDGFGSTAEMLQTASRAEQAGAHSLWFAQHMGYRDAFVWASAAACVTHSIMLVPTAITPYLWPPLPVAMALGTLAELSHGRAALAVSVGNLLNLSQSGAEALRPLTVMREYVQALRDLRTGGVVRQEGAIHRLNGARMAFESAGPYLIYVASTGPQMLALAGEIGDGVLLSAGLTRSSCRRCLEDTRAGARRSGRDPAFLRKAAFINMSVSSDGEAAKRAMLRKLAFLFRSRGHAENIKSSGLPIDHAAIIDSLARHDLDAATRLLPLEAAQAFAVAGTPGECREQLGEYLKIGIDEPILEISGTAEERRLALEVVRDTARSQ
jgi:5,10-methylenetetrahydromethanopterin reductase